MSCLLTFLHPSVNFVFCTFEWNLGKNSTSSSGPLGAFLLKYLERPEQLWLVNSPASEWIKWQREDLPNMDSWSLLSSFKRVVRTEKFSQRTEEDHCWKLDLGVQVLGVLQQAVTELRSLRFYSDQRLLPPLLSFQRSDRLLNKGYKIVSSFTFSPSSLLLHLKLFFWSAFVLPFVPMGVIRWCQSTESRILEAAEWGRHFTTRKVPWDMNCFN